MSHVYRHIKSVYHVTMDRHENWIEHHFIARLTVTPWWINGENVNLNALHNMTHYYSQSILVLKAYHHTILNRQN